MAKIYVDNKPYEVDAKRNLLDICLSLGFNLPYFCWHPAMGSVGACRQCAVKQFKDESDARGRLVMACMTPAADGTRISIQDPEAVTFRDGIIEGLMLSHPHDCPVCDEGGECHLQDMTVMTGHDYRRSRFNKRTFRNQYLGPLVNHEMNRCIQCYRCVRFYREYAGGHDLNAFALRNLVFFGREKDGVLENEFSGNLVEVCPTGVFTDATLKRHYTRKWDLQFAPSICVHCGLGCHTSAAERYGTLRRIVNRYDREVNGYFLCDRGRYGYEFVNSERRICGPVLRQKGVSKEEALKHLGSLLVTNGKAIGIGSPRASLEANFALRELVGAGNFFAGVSDQEHRLAGLMLEILRNGPARTPSLHDIELSDAVLVLGEDVTNEAPRMALSLRQSVRQQPMQIAEKLHIPLWLDHAVREAVQDAKGPLFIATPNATRLDDVAAETYRAAPDEIARLGFAVAHAIDAGAPSIPYVPDAVSSLAGRIAQALKSAKRPTVISGAGCCSQAVIEAAANVAHALCRNGGEAGLSFTAPEPNSFGLALLGGGSLNEAFQRIKERTADTVIILENDLYRRARAVEIDAFLDSALHVVVLDHLATPTVEKAELVFPAGSFAEADGTLVSSEGRAQRFFKVFISKGDIQESWRWMRDAMIAAGRNTERTWQIFDDVTTALAGTIPVFEKIPDAAPPAAFRMQGGMVPREPHRYSGRTAMLANINVHEPKPPNDPDAPLSFSMEGSPNQPPSPLIPFFWSPAWNSIQSVNKFQSEVDGPLRGGPAGVRIIEPAKEGDRAYFTEIPPAFEARADEWLIVPLYHIFGSEELSLSAPAVAKLVPKLYLALGTEDASQLQLGGEMAIEVTLCGSRRRLPVKIAPQLPKGVAGVPVGLPGLEGIALPAWSRISRV